MPPDIAASSDASLSPAAPAASQAVSGPWRHWRAFLGGALSLGLLVAILVQLGGTTSQSLATLLRLSPATWAAFALLYLAQPLADMAIFRRLWRLPLSGFAELLRKAVLNEIVLGYSGELYFYLWARRKAGPDIAPFAAIKDVNILSGLMGNALTLVMLAISVAGLKNLDLIQHLRPALWPGIAVVAVSLAVIVFARQVFSLAPRALAFVAGVHAVRLAATSGLTILVWTLALPSIALPVWIALLTLRLLVARIPLLTNKELIFGNVALLAAGPQSLIGPQLAALSVATLAAHLLTISLVGAGDLLRTVRSR